MGRTPFTGHLKPGKHTIYVEQWASSDRGDIEVKPGTATQHNFEKSRRRRGG